MRANMAGRETDMLIDEHDADVLALCGEALEGGLDRGRLRLVVDD